MKKSNVPFVFIYFVFTCITADFDSIRVWDVPDCWPNRKAPDQPSHTVQLPEIH